MAAPHVTGAIALCAAAYPSETVAQRIDRTLRTADRVPALDGTSVTGARLNLARAIAYDPSAPTVVATGVKERRMVPQGRHHHAHGKHSSYDDRERHFGELDHL